MITLKKSHERGFANRGGLKSYHSFSFADYYDPNNMGFANLRVINEDWVAPGKGFGIHSHKNMEILTYMLSGALAHNDSMGNTALIPHGDVLRLSAGTGIKHSEFNGTTDVAAHLLQIWLEPKNKETQPSYEKKTFNQSIKQGKLQLIASPSGAEGSVTINADAAIFAGILGKGETASLAIEPGHKCYVHVVRGEVEVNWGNRLAAGDGAKLVNESFVMLSDAEDAEVLVFELP